MILLLSGPLNLCSVLSQKLFADNISITKSEKIISLLAAVALLHSSSAAKKLSEIRLCVLLKSETDQWCSEILWVYHFVVMRKVCCCYWTTHKKGIQNLEWCQKCKGQKERYVGQKRLLQWKNWLLEAKQDTFETLPKKLFILLPKWKKQCRFWCWCAMRSTFFALFFRSCKDVRKNRNEISAFCVKVYSKHSRTELLNTEMAFQGSLRALTWNKSKRYIDTPRKLFHARLLKYNKSFPLWSLRKCSELL